MDKKSLGKYREGRAVGLKLALQIVENDGVDGLRNEIKFREKSAINPPIAIKEIDECADELKMVLYETILCQCLMVLHDCFGFGEKRLKKFMRRWSYKQECMQDGLVQWADYVDEVRNNFNLEISTSAMERNGLIPEYIKGDVLEGEKKSWKVSE